MVKYAKSLFTNSALYVPLTVTAIFMILPFVWMLSTSFKPQEEIFVSPPLLVSPNMSLDGYRFIIDMGVFRSLLNTLVLSLNSIKFSL